MTFMPEFERNRDEESRLEYLNRKMREKKNRKKPPEPTEDDDVELFRRGKLAHWQLDSIDQKIAEEQA